MAKGIFKVCTYVFGYKTCAKVVGLSVGKKVARYGAEAILGSFLPIRVVKCAVAAAPYAPAVVVLATGGTGAIVANASYIVISQLTDYLFVCAVRTAVTTSVKTTFRVVKYVFITKPFGLVSGDTGKDELADGWILVEDEDLDASRNAIQQLLQTIQKAEGNGEGQPEGGKVEVEMKEMTEEMVSESLAYAEKVARELDVEGLEFEEEVVFEKGDGGDQIVFEKDGGKEEVMVKQEGNGGESAVHETVEMPEHHKEEDEGFVMV